MKEMLMSLGSIPGNIAYFESRTDANAWAVARYGKKAGFALRQHMDIGGLWDVVPPAPAGESKIRWMQEAQGARR